MRTDAYQRMEADAAGLLARSGEAESALVGLEADLRACREKHRDFAEGVAPVLQTCGEVVEESSTPRGYSFLTVAGVAVVTAAGGLLAGALLL